VSFHLVDTRSGPRPLPFLTLRSCSSVLDFSLINWLDKSQVSYPALFDVLASGNHSYRGVDATMQIMRDNQRALADCMADVIRVGFVEGMTIGCLIADIVLYVSLVFIIGVVTIRFAMAVLFGWILSWRLGSFGRKESAEDRARRAAEIEAWTDDIYRPAPSKYRPNASTAKKHKSYLPTKSRFTYQPQKSVTTFPVDRTASRPVSTVYPAVADRRSTVMSLYGGQHSPQLKGSRSTASLYAPSGQVRLILLGLFFNESEIDSIKVWWQWTRFETFIPFCGKRRPWLYSVLSISTCQRRPAAFCFLRAFQLSSVPHNPARHGLFRICGRCPNHSRFARDNRLPQLSQGHPSHS
jgi:hypothetical protein